MSRPVGEVSWLDPLLKGRTVGAVVINSAGPIVVAWILANVLPRRGDDALVHEALAIVGCCPPSALAHDVAGP